ncbi:MAG TPA: hypothetical protein VIV40_09770 [Kofleriaceae bacterium]
MTYARLACATVFVSAALFGCGKKDSTDKAEKSDKTVEKKETAKKPLTAELFGKKVAPVGLLAKLKWASSEAEARAAAPELFPKPNTDFQLADDPSLEGVAYGVGVDKDTKKLSRMYVQIPGSAAKLIETAWGPGKVAKDTIGRPRTYWFDPETGWRAYLEKGFGEDMNLELYPYIPAAKLLGDGPDTLGFAPQGILGATVAELRTRFPDTIVETDEAKAKEQQKKVGNFVGKDLEKELGAASANVRIDLPPTEWEQYWTRIQTYWSKDGKVEDVWFKLPYDAYEPAKEELRALFEKKWGKPKEEKEFGTAGDPIWVYRAKAPRIFVKDDTITHGWDVHLTTKKD